MNYVIHNSNDASNGLGCSTRSHEDPTHYPNRLKVATTTVSTSRTSRSTRAYNWTSNISIRNVFIGVPIMYCLSVGL